MTQISSISELLTLSNCQYRVYDLGRIIAKLSKSDFEKIEANKTAYPFPIQGNAHLAIAFWQQRQQEPYIWFVKLPIDEQGYLVQASRNHFLHIIIEALGNDLSVDPNARQEEILKSNPYHFTPPQYKLASFNAKLKASLKKPASSQYEHCQLYMSGKLGWDNWRGVGIQGLCDYAARTVDNENDLISALPFLPMQVLSPLLSALENESLSNAIATKLLTLLNQALKANESERSNLFLRSLASSTSNNQVKAELQQLITGELHLNFEHLITLAARCWPILDNEKIVFSFLEKLASLKNVEQFTALFSDIIALPQLRPILLTSIRMPHRSAELAEAVGALFTQVKR